MAWARVAWSASTMDHLRVFQFLGRAWCGSASVLWLRRGLPQGRATASRAVPGARAGTAPETVPRSRSVLALACVNVSDSRFEPVPQTRLSRGRGRFTSGSGCVLQVSAADRLSG